MWFFFNSAALGVGLAMDAFSVAAANGLREPRMRLMKMLLIAGCFAFFQAAMPMAGWLLVHTLLTVFGALKAAVGYIALFLLCFIGVRMLLEKPGEAAAPRLTPGVLLMQGVATSIDALSVGTAIGAYGPGRALVCSLIIACVTFVMSCAGALLGKRLGAVAWAEKAGGVILILIGIEICVKGLL